MGPEERVTILVVEDSEVMRHQISASLRVLGYTKVTCVSHGQAALDFLLVNRCDIVISDWYMAPVNGLELLRELRGHGPHRDISFLMVTGETAKEKILHAVLEGIDGYVVKPYTVNQLGLKIHEALKRRGKV